MVAGMSDTRPGIDDPRPSDNRPLLVGLLFVLALLGLTVVRTLPPEALPADAPADRFSEARARAVLERILGDERPHPIGSEANTAVRRRVVDELRALGLEPEERAAFVCAGGRGPCGRVVNVIARIPGRSDRKAVLVSAHHDSVPAAPGASDAGSGVAAIIEVARLLLAGEPLERPVLILINDGEEAGLLGARAFVDSPEAEEVFGVVNLEARGTSGPSAMFETGPGNAAVVGAWARESRRPVASSTLNALYELLPNDTDLTVFKAEGWQGLNFAFADGLPRYHTPLDELAHLDPRTFQHHGDNTLAAVRALASLPDEAVSGEDAVWLDLLSAVVVRWPMSWNWTLFAVCLALWVIGVVIGVRRRKMKRWQPLVAGIMAPGLMTLPLIIVTVGGLGLSALAGYEPYWTAHPGWSAALFAATSVALTLMGVAQTTRWFGSWTWWSGCGFLMIVLALLPLVRLPAAAGLCLVPALALNASLCLALVAPARWRLPIHLVGLGGAALPWLSIAYALHVMMGVETAIPTALTAALLSILAATTMTAAKSRWLVPLGAALVAIACGLVVWLLPSYSDSRPAHAALVHAQDAETQDAAWLATGSLSEPFLDALALERGRIENWPIPGRALERGMGTAPPLDSPGPVLEILESEPMGEGRRVRVRLHSPRGATVARLTVAGAAKLTGMSVEGIPRDVPAGGHARCDLRGLPREGVTITLDFPRSEPALVTIQDEVHELPDFAGPLLSQRASNRVPVQDGDRSILYRTLTLP
jgi:hypothetical protein